MEDLTLTDLDILIESLTAWEADASALVGDLIVNMVASKEMRETDEFKQQAAVREHDSSVKKATRAEASIMLKAKLITIKNQLIAESIL